MGGDDQKRRSTTKRFTREELAELAEKARGECPNDAEEAVPTGAPDAVQPEITPMSRSQTLHDPLTTQLLAEVARRLHQTIELEVDPDQLPEAAEAEDVVKVPHPHLRRRRT